MRSVVCERTVRGWMGASDYIENTRTWFSRSTIETSCSIWDAETASAQTALGRWQRATSARFTASTVDWYLNKIRRFFVGGARRGSCPRALPLTPRSAAPRKIMMVIKCPLGKMQIIKRHFLPENSNICEFFAFPNLKSRQICGFHCTSKN